MAFRLERRFSGGFHLLTNYTWSKSIDTESRSIDDGASPHQVSTNRALDRGLSSFDVRQRFVTSAIWELPWDPGSASLARPAVGRAGWFAAGRQHNRAAPDRQSILHNGCRRSIKRGRPGDPAAAPDRPRHSAKLGEATGTLFDTGAYTLNPMNTFGNAGRDTLYEDGVQTIDLSLFKNSYFGEGRYNLQFRVEFFNLFNTADFGRPGQVVNGAIMESWPRSDRHARSSSL